MQQVERVERHGLEELRARGSDHRRLVGERIDERMVDVDADPRVGQLDDKRDARATEVRVLLTRDATQREELAKRDEGAVFVLVRQARQLARPQVAKERECEVAVERGVNPVVAVVADAPVAGRRAVAPSKQRLGGIEHLGRSLPTARA